MYAGRAVEEAPVTELYARPRHPYTAGLMRALPSAAVTLEDGRRRLTEIPGLVPPPYADPEECAFHPRCPRAQDDCTTRRPALDTHGTGHLAACFHPLSAAAPATGGGS
jgi:oligopeptide/dipeptide ABC transporter ATP-binding protein